MWEIPFDESMLNENQNLIIHCPDKSLADELMEILERNGVKWGGGESPVSDSMWTENREETCYWVESKCLSYDDRDFADSNDRDYANHIKCTFYGKDEQTFEPANDSEMQGFLGF